MGRHWRLVIVAIVTTALLGANLSAALDLTDQLVTKEVKGKKVCKRGWACPEFSKFCCNQTIPEFLDVDQFQQLFPNINAPTAHAVGFWDYQSFVLATIKYAPLGFGTTGGKLMGQLELAAFLGHVGSQTSCGYGVATGGPTAWGLCYNKELSPSQKYCDDSYKYTYPCTPGADYYGRGALPIYWNYNYGQIGDALQENLLDHPEYIEQNATLAFQAAIYSWMTPKKKGQPSCHDAFVGNWKPNKNDTLSKRVPGFGVTMNILYGDRTCGQGDVDDMNTIITHYLYYLDEMGVGRERAGPAEVLSCAEQKPFNPSGSASS
uniref:Chi2 n=1 Tax=Limonium bicolor TaxID=293754 RepID=B3VFX1_9CARY|nr:chi2 [Limonium bicolor]